MEKIDIESVLERLGIRIWNRVGDEIWGWCPDHYLFTKREPSDPKWSLNSLSGDTYCFTESRGSNLVYIVSRLLKKNTEEAIEWILDDKVSHELEIMNMINNFKKVKEVNRQRLIDRLDIKNIIEENKMFESGYCYFMYPPNKKPTLINKSTVDEFKCIQVEYGRYANRVVIPFYNGELVGFCATDILGKEKWLEIHPTLSQKEYKKVLFNDDLKKEYYLFGLNRIEKHKGVIITEGAREVMKLWQLGYNAVACLGSSISDGQIRKLSEKYVSNVILMFDGDDAGRMANYRCYEKMDEFFNVNIVELPEGEDPKTMDGKELKKIIESRENSLDFLR